MPRAYPRKPSHARGINRWGARCAETAHAGFRGRLRGKGLHTRDLAAQSTQPYVPTWQGWLYLATVIDCHTKEVIGWATGDNYKTPLIEKAIEMAARNYPLAENAIFHSDRGSNPRFKGSSQQ